MTKCFGFGSGFGSGSDSFASAFMVQNLKRYTIIFGSSPRNPHRLRNTGVCFYVMKLQSCDIIYRFAFFTALVQG
jgi:hypothetical protein